MSDFFNKYPYTDFHELNLDWILETVKRIAAEWAETLTEWHDTQEEWQQLYNYVHDYFDNLDVQAEINIKLDEMALDGSLATAVQPIIESKVAEMIPDEVSAQLPTAVSAQIDSVVADQIGDAISGQVGPLIAPTVTDWLNNNVTPVGGAVVVDDSLSISGAAADAKRTGDLLKLSEYDILDMTDSTLNKYIKYADGTMGNVNFCTATDYIEINGADYIYCGNVFNSTTPGTIGMAFYDADKTYISGVQYDNIDISASVPSNAIYLRATVVTANIGIAYIYASIDHGSLHDLMNVSGLENAIDLSNSVSDKFINSTNGETGSLAGSTITDYIRIPDKSRIIIRNVDTTHTADPRGVAFYDGSKQFISGVAYTGETSFEISMTVPNGTKFIRLTIATTLLSDAVMLVGVNYKEILDIEDLQTDYNILSAFKNIRCIGDSLTYSKVYTSALLGRQAFRPYPDVLATITGASVQMLAHSGDNCITAWNRQKDYLTSATAQLTILYLGTNGGLTNTLHDDCPVALPYTDWADTNTGCYAKFIAKSIEIGSRVVLVKPWITSGAAGISDLTITNSVIDQMATRFDVAIVGPINMSDIKYHYFPDLTGSNATHLNDLGYCAFAHALVDRIASLQTDEMKYLIPEA